MNYFRLIICILVISLGLGGTAGAEVSCRTEIDDNQILTISFTSGEADTERQLVTFEILMPGKSDGDLLALSSDAFLSTVLYADELELNPGGSTSSPINIKLTDTMGYYRLRYMYDGLTEPLWTDGVLYITPTFGTQISSEINSAASASDIKTNMDNVYASLIAYDVSDYNGMSASVKDAALELLIADSAAFDGGYSNINEVKQAFNLAMLATLIDEAPASDESGVQSLITKYKDPIGLSAHSAYKTAETYLSSTQLLDIASDVKAAAPFSSGFKLMDMYCEKIILDSLLYLGNQSNVEDILNDNEAYLGLDLAAYNALSVKKDVNTALQGKSFASIAAMKSAFNTAVAKAYETGGGSIIPGTLPSNPVISSPGGSGGGSVSLPSTLAPEITTGNTEGGFTDLGGVEWAKEAITYLKDKGIVNGVDKDSFNPGGDITRAEYIKMIVMSFFTLNPSAASAFPDSTPDDWHYQYISTAYALGITNGKADGSFGADEKISRQDMAVMAVRAIEAAGLTLGISGGSSAFADESDMSDYAKASIYKMSDAGIVNGMGGGIFAPLNSATRAEAAKIIYGLIKTTKGGIGK